VDFSFRGQSFPASFSEYAVATALDLPLPQAPGGTRILAHPEVARLLAEQLQAAISSFEAQRSVHADIKLDNIHVMGRDDLPVSAESIVRGDHFFVLADQDLVVRRGLKSARWLQGTPELFAPELISRQGVYHSSTSLWAAALSVWEAAMGTSLLRHPELNQKEGGIKWIRERFPLRITEDHVRVAHRIVMREMNAKIAERARAGDSAGADQWVAVRDFILRGLSYDPAARTLQPLPTPETPEVVAARAARIQAYGRARQRGETPANGGPAHANPARGSESTTALPVRTSELQSVSSRKNCVTLEEVLLAPH
jgi:hypothetical protein